MMVSQAEPRYVAAVLEQAGRELEQAGVGEARLEAALLLGFCLNKSRTELYLAARSTVAERHYHQFRTLLARRCQREPLAYIVGEREFWSLPFFVTPAVLIPRPETEFLIETVLRRCQWNHLQACLDLCCGSGVIAVVLARELKIPVCAVDISAQALTVSRANCIRHKVEEQVTLVQADLASCFKNGGFSLIVSNPPYVASADIDNHLEPEVARFEPRLALDGGSTGLQVITRISMMLPALLKPGGNCFIEIGDGQGASVRKLFQYTGVGNVRCSVSIIKDYADRDRVAHIHRQQ